MGRHVSQTQLSLLARRSRRGQATLELGVAMIGFLVLFFGFIKTFLWFNERYVQRQINYEQTRVDAGREPPRPDPDKPLQPNVVKWQEPAKLNLFNERGKSKGPGRVNP